MEVEVSVWRHHRVCKRFYFILSVFWCDYTISLLSECSFFELVVVLYYVLLSLFNEMRRYCIHRSKWKKLVIIVSSSVSEFFLHHLSRRGSTTSIYHVLESIKFSSYITLDNDNVIYVGSFKLNLLSVHKLIKSLNCSVPFYPYCRMLLGPLNKPGDWHGMWTWWAFISSWLRIYFTLLSWFPDFMVRAPWTSFNRKVK